MPTNTVLGDRLVQQALALCGARSKREVVDLALRQMVAGHRQRGLKSLVGRDPIASGCDVRAVRRAMARGAG